MKLRTERRSDRALKFFKPSLYLRYNSEDDAIADRADAEWERAIRAYKKQLSTISDQMNERVRFVAESLSLHDAQLFSFQPEIPVQPWFQPPYCRGAATISLRSEGTIIHLFYVLWDQVGESTPPKGWPFSPLGVHWLYDEVDRAEAPWPSLFWHRILLSDGRVLSIPFTDVIVESFPVPDSEPVSATGRDV